MVADQSLAALGGGLGSFSLVGRYDGSFVPCVCSIQWLQEYLFKKSQHKSKMFILTLLMFNIVFSLCLVSLQLNYSIVCHSIVQRIGVTVIDVYMHNWLVLHH
jgi:hypothetical protein